MPLFEFEKIYTRETQVHPDAIPSVEALFVMEEEQDAVMYRLGDFYRVNKGPMLSINSFSHWKFLYQFNAGKPFRVIKLYHNIDDIYMVLEEGMIKIGNTFSTHHGCPVEQVGFATPSLHSNAYAVWQEAIKNGEEFSLIDFRYL